jgi:hypothetical protein
MYYFQKFFGDQLVHSSVAGSSNVVSYASRFTSGQTGLVLINKGTSDQVVSVSLSNFETGKRFYYYLLTGGTDNGDYSRKVYVNGKTTTADGGGPSDYATLKPWGTTIGGDIRLNLPRRAVLYVVVDQKKEPQAQAIQFPPIPSKVFGDGDFTISASATSGLPVVITTSDPLVASVIQGKIRITGAGSCSITVSQPGNEDYLAAAPVSQTLTVQKAGQTITFPALAAKKTGDPDFSPAAVASSGLPCSYTSSNPEVAQIVNNQIRITGAGQTTITAAQEGNTNYQAAAAVPQILTVTVPTGIKMVGAVEDFELFPNPASGYVTIRMNKAIGEVVFYNAWGSVVYRKIYPSSECTIPVKSIGSPGIYLVKVNTAVKRVFIVPGTGY